MQQLKQSTVDKYLGFFHTLKFQLAQDNPEFKISHLVSEWKVNNNVLTAAINARLIERVSRGEYRWIGGTPTEALVRKIVEETFSRPSNAIEAEINDLKTRLGQLEDIVLKLMEAA